MFRVLTYHFFFQSLARCIPGVGLYFSSLHMLKSNWLNRTNKTTLGPIEAVMLGMTARTISGVCMIPFTVLKTRFEVNFLALKIFKQKFF